MINQKPTKGDFMRLKTLILSMALATTTAYASSDEYHHFAGLFVGATTVDSETDFSYGIEYEYKFSKLWGAGFVFEKTDDAHHGAGVDIALAAVYLHPWKELRIGAGFGQEKVGSYTDHDHHHHNSHKEDVVRASLSYDFHIGGFGVAPTIAVDFVDGETATVIGVALIKSF